MTPAEKRQLLAMQTVVHEKAPANGRGVSAEAFALVNAPVDQVWAVLLACEDYDSFLPNVRKSGRRVVDGKTVCSDELALPFPLKALWSDTSSQVVDDGPTGARQRIWKMLEGNYEHTFGTWTVFPFGAGRSQTLVVYFFDTKPAEDIPDWVMRVAQTQTLPAVFAGIRKRVAQLN